MHMLRAPAAALILATTLGAQTPPPAGMIRDAAVRRFALVVKADGSVVGWGNNQDGNAGEAGPGGGIVRTPIAIPLPGKARQVALGLTAQYALLEDGTVVAWGLNADGQLGNGPLGASGEMGRYPKPSASPVRVTGLSDIIQIDAGSRHALALRGDGTVWAWGQRDNGAIGDGEAKTLRPTNAIGPVKVPGLEGITQIATYLNHNLALRRDGHVMAWGSNKDGELGLGTRTIGWTPAEVPGLDHIVAIDAGSAADHGVSGAVRDDGTVWLWGSGTAAIMGNGSSGAISPDDPGGRVLAPVALKGITDAKRIALGDGHAAALLADGTLWMWGFNGTGQVGVGRAAGAYLKKPVRVTALANVSSLYLGSYNSFAVLKDGSFWIWGWDIPGGGMKNNYVPARMDLP